MTQVLRNLCVLKKLYELVWCTLPNSTKNKKKLLHLVSASSPIQQLVNTDQFEQDPITDCSFTRVSSIFSSLIFFYFKNNFILNTVYASVLIWFVKVQVLSLNCFFMHLFLKSEYLDFKSLMFFNRGFLCKCYLLRKIKMFNTIF